MKRFVLSVASIILFITPIGAATYKGYVKDAKTGEELIGATIFIKEYPNIGSTTGLDGSFVIDNVPSADKITIVCSYISYQTMEKVISASSTEPIMFDLPADTKMLEEVTVIAHNPGRTEAGARGIEKKAMNVVNVMSAKAIELSPDITVANVIQRMSGVTIERNSSGEGQYAILRGMDKRYNYTLINGVKIPSPDNKNRFVPLDIFPSEMLDR